MGYRLPTNPNSVTIAGHTVALGGSQTLAASDLTNGITGSSSVVLATAPSIASPTFAGAGSVTAAYLSNGVTTNAELIFHANNGGLNVIGVQNDSTAGFSAIIARDNNGHERGAWGYGNGSSVGQLFGQAAYWEGSVDVENQSSSSTPDHMRIIQSGGNTALVTNFSQGAAWVHQPRLDFATDLYTTSIPRTFNTSPDGNAAAFIFDAAHNTMAIGAGSVNSSGNPVTAPAYALDIGYAAAQSGDLRLRVANTSVVGNVASTVQVIGTANNTSSAFPGRVGLARFDWSRENVSGDLLGMVAFGASPGSNGSTYAEPYYSASIQGVADGTLTSTSAMPIGLSFRVGSTGNLINGLGPWGSEKMHLYATGDLMIGQPTDTGNLLDVNGNVSFSGTVLLGNNNVSPTVWVGNGASGSIGSRGTGTNFNIGTWDSAGQIIINAPLNMTPVRTAAASTNGLSTTIVGQAAGSGAAQNGGNVNITPGAGSGTGSAGVINLNGGSVSMPSLPTADPHVAGRVWSNSGILTVSAG